MLENLVKTIRKRKNQREDKSYTSSLLSSGLAKCIDKMQEEFGEAELISYLPGVNKGINVKYFSILVKGNKGS